MGELIDGFCYEGKKVADTRVLTDVSTTRCWEERKFRGGLMNPINRYKLHIIVMGADLAGGAVATSLGEVGCHVDTFYHQDSTRHAHSTIARSGIDVARDYRGGSGSTYRSLYDTVKGRGYGARENNMYHLTEVSANTVDQCVAQGVPFVREYDGLLGNRLFGGIQVAHTFYARGQTGQQLLTGAHQAFSCQVKTGTVILRSRCETTDLIAKDGRARGVVTRSMCTGEIKPWIADAVILATGDYGDVFFLSTNTTGYSGFAVQDAYEQGACFGSPHYTQTHSTYIPQHRDFRSKLTSMPESLRSDERIWVPKHVENCSKDPRDIPGEDRDYYLKHIYSSFGNLVPRGIVSYQAKSMYDRDHRANPRIGGVAHRVCLNFSEAINRMRRDKIPERYSNLFSVYERITGDNPYEVSIRICPAVHYAMDGLWADCGLMNSIPGLYVTGEASFLDHGVGRLGVSALIQDSSDGYFAIPAILSDYLARGTIPGLKVDSPAVIEILGRMHHKTDTLTGIQGTRSTDSFHKELGQIMRKKCGMEHTDTGLHKAVGQTRVLRGGFWKNSRVPGRVDELNQSLERVYRLTDFTESGELMCIDTLHRRESYGDHFCVESQTEEGEVKCDDENSLYITAQEHGGKSDTAPILHRKNLIYRGVQLK